MKPGIKPKSIEQHKKEGTLRLDRQKAATPVVLGGRIKPPCPKELKGHARKAFRFIVKNLWEAGVLDYADSPLIVTAARFYGRAMEASDEIAANGYMVEVVRGKYGRAAKGYTVREVNPAVRHEREALAQFRACCELLGIGPSARARLAALGIKGRDPAKEIAGIGTAQRLRAVPDNL